LRGQDRGREDTIWIGKVGGQDRTGQDRTGQERTGQEVTEDGGGNKLEEMEVRE
jgi:hypothetical protein